MKNQFEKTTMYTIFFDSKQVKHNKTQDSANLHSASSYNSFLIHFMQKMPYVSKCIKISLEFKILIKIWFNLDELGYVNWENLDDLVNKN